MAVDIALDGPLPKGARPDLTVDGTIELERLENAVFVGRPAQGQADTQVGLFRLEPAGKIAVRVKVRLGRASVSSIEIVEGLDAGRSGDPVGHVGLGRLRPDPAGVGPRRAVPRPAWGWNAVEGEREAMITLRNVEKSYPAGSRAVLRAAAHRPRDPRGRVRHDHGPVGRGQVDAAAHPRHATTAPARASTVFLDQPVHTLKPKDRLALQQAHIGFVFQSYHLIDDLTVYENLDMPLSYRNVKASERARWSATRSTASRSWARRTSIPASSPAASSSSSAWRGRSSPSRSCILADEPTGNLHSDQGREIMELFKKLNDEGTTIVQVTHSETNAAYGHRIIQLRDGWIANGKRATLPTERDVHATAPA